jgi:geranylgeranyl diphosphate synthase type II
MAGEGDIQSLALRLRQVVERRLAELTPVAAGCARLTESMAYSLLAPAKRVRAVLMLVAARQSGALLEAAALDAACAVEMVHAASLVLDDLPAMDDADLRRGRSANHRTYGEATAILAAVALLNRAFEVVLEAPLLSAEQRVSMLRILARSVGPEGLTGGQERDLNASSGGVSGAELEWIHAHKTGALFAAALEMVAVAACGSATLRGDLARIGLEIGLAFQAYDDLLDALASRERAGKTVGRDCGKATAVALFGIEEAERQARAHLAAATELIRRASPTGTELAAYVEHLTESLRTPFEAPGQAVMATLRDDGNS